MALTTKSCDVKVLKSMVSKNYDGIKTNFSSWKSDIELFVEIQGLENHLKDDGAAMNSTDQLVNKSLKAGIISTLDPILRPPLQQLSWTADVWKYLCQINEPKEPDRANEIGNLLFHFSIKANDNIETKVLELRHLFEEWKKAGANGKPSEFIEFFRHALCEEFAPIKDGMEHEIDHRKRQSLAEHTIDEMAQYVISKVHKKQGLLNISGFTLQNQSSRGSQQQVVPVYHSATVPTISNVSSSGSSTVHCSWCNTGTHKTDDCNSLKRVKQQRDEFRKRRANNDGANNNGTKEVICFNCNKPGHIKPNCPSLTNTNKNLKPTTVPNTVARVNNALVTYSNPDVSNHWIVDSGASQHCSGNLSVIQNPKPLTGVNVTMPNGSIAEATLAGDVALSVKGPHGLSTIVLQDVLYVDGLQANLLSVGKLNGLHLNYSSLDKKSPPNLCNIMDYQMNQVLCSIPKQDGLFTLVPESHVDKSTVAICHVSAGQKVDYQLLHERLGHANHSRILKLVTSGLVDGVAGIIGKPDPAKPCPVCAECKDGLGSHSKPATRATKPLELVHSDVCGPVTASQNGNCYIVTFIDDFSRYVMAYFVKTKDQVPIAFEDYVRQMRVLCQSQSLRVLKIKSDNGGEYSSHWFREICLENGIQHDFTSPYNPQQNGVAERYNRTLWNMVRSMLTKAVLPPRDWVHAAAAAIYVNNRNFTSAVPVTPYQALLKKKPDLSHLRVFGCICWAPVHIHRKDQNPFEACRFLGYSTNSNSYLVRQLYGGEIRVVSCKDVKFDESKFHILKQAPIGVSLLENEDPRAGWGFMPVITNLVPGVVSQPSPPVSIPTNDTADLQEASSHEDDSADHNQGENISDCDNDPSSAGHFNTATNELPHQLGREYSSFQQVGRADTQEPRRSTRLKKSTAVPESKPKPVKRRGQLEYEVESIVGHEIVDGQIKYKVKWKGYGFDECTNQSREDLKNSPIILQNYERTISAQEESLEPVVEQDEEIQTNVAINNAIVTYGSAVPKNLTEALQGEDQKEWLEATQKELDSMVRHEVFTLVDLPPGAKCVGSRFVLDIKRDGRKKVRLVAQGYTQQQGIDYDGTYSPVLNARSFRLLMALANKHQYSIKHLDVSNAFLNGTLEHSVYMKQPAGFEDADHPDKVWKLQKSIYGLKQGGRQWNSTIDDWFVIDLGFTKSEIDPCLYYKKMPDGENMYIGLYVDDILDISSDLHTDWFAKQLTKRFESKDLGEVSDFLGMSVIRHRDTKKILIHQEQYCLSVLERFKMSSSSPEPTPLAQEVLTSEMSPVTVEEQRKMAYVPYREAIGCLNYLTICTRPDIAVAVSSVAKFVEHPGPKHWTAVKRILRYLKGTTSYGIAFGSAPSSHDCVELSAFVDASYADQEDMRSTIGYVTQVEGGPLHWKTKKTGKIATSTTEAEYIGQAYCAKEIVSERMLLESIGQTQNSPTLVHGDNEAALKLATKEGISELTKHIKVRYHYIREAIQDNEITLKHVGSLNNVADILTKGITMKDRYCRLRKLLGMSTPHDLASITEDMIKAYTEVKEGPNEEKVLKKKGMVVVRKGFVPVPVPINEYLYQSQKAVRRSTQVPAARESVEIAASETCVKTTKSELSEKLAQSPSQNLNQKPNDSGATK